jgi:hypothetical protein
MTATTTNPRFQKFANPDAPEPDVSTPTAEQMRAKARENLLAEERLKQEVRRQVQMEMATAEAAGNAWGRMDLSAIYAEGLEIQEPTIVRRSDGKGLFYGGLPNVIFGDPSAGKTAFLQYAAAEEMRAGHAVYVVDYETHAKMWLSRMRALGLPDELVAEKLYYLDLSDGARPPLEFDPTARLVVIDSLSSVVSATAGDSNAIEGIEAAYRQVVTPFSRAGLAVVLIDHLGNGDKGRPMGSMRKTGIVQGAMYKMENDPNQRFARGRAGSSTISLYKDNAGGTGASKGEAVARFVMDSTQPAMRCKISPIAPAETLAEMAAQTQDATVLAKQRVYEALMEDSGNGFTKASLREHAKCNYDVWTRVFQEMTEAGIIAEFTPVGTKKTRYCLARL